MPCMYFQYVISCGYVGFMTLCAFSDDFVGLCFYLYVYVLENITTEQDISADILRVWLSGYILQQYVYVCGCLFC
jgi:hypothetical protein